MPHGSHTSAVVTPWIGPVCGPVHYRHTSTSEHKLGEGASVDLYRVNEWCRGMDTAQVIALLSAMPHHHWTS